MPISEPDVETSSRIYEEWKDVMATDLNRLASLAVGANCLAPPRPQLLYVLYVLSFWRCVFTISVHRYCV